MEEPQCSIATLPSSLPPGCRFFPSKEQLLCYYLPNKNAGGSFHGCDLIRELDLFDYDPFQLPEIACFSYGYRGRKRHWYCYTARVLKEDSRRKTRMVKSGYWMRKGGVRNVFNGGGNVVLGTRTTFVFYLGNSFKNAGRTNLMLHEYALVDHLKAAFVVCRVFFKALHKNSVSENGLSSCAEESFSAVRHIGVQYNGCVSRDIETQICGDCSIDRKISVSPLKPVSELYENQIADASASVATFQCCAGPPDSETGKLSGLPGGGAIVVEELASQQHLLAILEEDFIELDDLA